MKYLIPVLFVAILALTTTCGRVDHQHKGTVSFQITVDQVVLSKYFGAQCAKEKPLATPEELELCVEESIGAFLNAISAIAGTPKT